MAVLPPMRREILAEVLKIVFLSGALSLTLIISIYFIGKNPYNIFYLNYQHINSMLVISDTLDSIYLTKKSFKQLQNNEKNDLELSLKYLEKNIDYNLGLKLIKKINILIDEYKNNGTYLSDGQFIQIRKLLRSLIQENEKNNSKIVLEKELFSKNVLFLSFFIFLLALFIAVYFSERLSGRISHPIKKISEVLQYKPNLGQKLKFPEPENLEIKNLIIELNDLWKRLSDLNSANIKNLLVQRNELDAVLDVIDDAIFILDHLGKIEHHNKTFAQIMGARKNYLNFQPWADVSLSTTSYIQLRNFLRKDNFEEGNFFASVDGRGHVFHVRKRIIYDGNKNRYGTIYILHDISSTFSSEKFSEISMNLQDAQSKYE